MNYKDIIKYAFVLLILLLFIVSLIIIDKRYESDQTLEKNRKEENYEIIRS